MPDNKPQDKELNIGPATVPQEAIRSATESRRVLAVVLMRDASRIEKWTVWVCDTFAGLTVVGLAMPPYVTVKVLILISLLGAFLIVALTLMIRHNSRLTLQNRAAAVLPSLLPFPPYKASKLLELLELTREQAVGFLKAYDNGLADSDVRSNMFFPKCDSAGKVVAKRLSIYSGLSCKMELPREREITFKPGQGATGRVFADGARRVVQRLTSGNGDWDDVYKITKELAEIIHPDLRWIISMPILGADRKPIGVINVDGLQRTFSYDILVACMGQLTSSVSVVNQLVLFG